MRTRQRYFCHESRVGDATDNGCSTSSDWLLAKIREIRVVGGLVDAFADSAFCLAIVRAIEALDHDAVCRRRNPFHATTAFAELAAPGIEPVQHLGREQSNTSVILGEACF